MGKNKGWKDNIKRRKTVIQNFTGIPYNIFISALTYKANEKGIKVIETEESYTSKASFIDNDDIPTYGVNDSIANFKPLGRPLWSCVRIKRGMYKSKEDILSGKLNSNTKEAPTSRQSLEVGVVHKGF